MPGARRGGALSSALPVLALWVALATGLSAITGRVGDWFVMTDELLYERFAISIARTLSPLAQIRGHVTSSLDQLYPLLIAPIYRSGLVPDDLHDAHLLNAWVMSSACIPAFLLARRVTGRRWVAYVLGTLAVCMPWIVYAPFLLTEVAAYPAFLWALLAMQRATATPSRRNDLLALGGIALAFFGRTQFALLVGVFPLAILAAELGRAADGGIGKQVLGALREILRTHRLLVVSYGLFALAAVFLRLTGQLSRLLGAYGDTLSGTHLQHNTAEAFLDHLVTVALGVGILPVVVGLAWMLANLVKPSANRESHAFACLGVVTFAAILLQVTIFDLRLGVGIVVYDRYLMYLAPVAILGLFCALFDAHRPRWSLVFTAGLVAAGFAINKPAGFLWSQFPTLSSDAPVSSLYRPIVHALHSLGGARAGLAVLTLVLAGLFALGASRLDRRRFSVLVTTLLLAAIPAETGYTLSRLFGANGWSGRPLTAKAHGVQDWIDGTIGTNADVTMIPYPVSSDWFVNLGHWRDLEFWNKSVDRSAYYQSPTVYRFTGNTFPTIPLTLDRSTGAVSVSPTQWVAQSDKETRFRIAGVARAAQSGVLLVDAGKHWRLDWMSFGLYDDGWTKPGVTARVRVFPTPGQRVPTSRSLALFIRPPSDVAQRAVRIASDLGRFDDTATNGGILFKSVRICVPPKGFTDVRIATPDSSTIPGDLSDLGSTFKPREGGVFLAAMSLADEIGGPCRPSRPAPAAARSPANQNG